MADPLAGLPANPACYGTSDIARLRATADRLTAERDMARADLARVITERDERLTLAEPAPDHAQRDRTRIEKAIEKRLREAWPNWPIDDVWVEQVAAEAALAVAEREDDRG